MRVLRLCSVFEPPAGALDGRATAFDPIGGMQEHAGSLTRELGRRGVEQVVLTTRPPGAPRIERLGPHTRVVRVSLPVRKPRQLYSLPAAVLAPLLGSRADLVHVHLGEDLAILPLAAMAARPRRLPVVLTVHCSLTHTLAVDDLRSALLHAVGGAIERRGVRRADVTLVYTERLAELLDGDGPGAAVRVMRRGVDPQPFARARERRGRRADGGRSVVFVGRLVNGKGVATLVEAAARVRTPGVRFALVGDGPQRGSVERRARALGIADRVRVTGFVPHDRVPSVLADADLLVLPSYYEELGTVLIEALHAGLPVVASAVGGIPEVVEDGVNGLLVPPRDAAALARAIDSIVADPALAGRMGAEALRRAPAHDLRNVGSEIHELYRDLVGTRDALTAPGALPAPALAASGAVLRAAPSRGR